MTDIARIQDTEGRTHFTARGSQAAEKLLADGAVDLDPPQATEVTDAPADAETADDQHAGTTGSGSGQRKRAPRNTDSGDVRTGVAEPEVGS